MRGSFISESLSNLVMRDLTQGKIELARGTKRVQCLSIRYCNEEGIEEEDRVVVLYSVARC